MSVYHVKYKMYNADKVKGIDVIAKNKFEAHSKATYEIFLNVEKAMPYSAWVSSVTYNNGNYREFNTFEGNPY